jgi:hypothetical protein
VKTFKSKALVYASWGLITALFMTVVKFKTEVGWAISLALSLFTGLFGCALSFLMVRWTDRQQISRLRLIVFCGSGLVLTLVVPSANSGSFDRTGMKMLLFTAAGLLLTAFFLPLSRPVPPKARGKNSSLSQ